MRVRILLLPRVRIQWLTNSAECWVFQIRKSKPDCNMLRFYPTTDILNWTNLECDLISSNSTLPRMWVAFPKVPSRTTLSPAPSLAQRQYLFSSDTLGLTNTASLLSVDICMEASFSYASYLNEWCWPTYDDLCWSYIFKCFIFVFTKLSQSSMLGYFFPYRPY